MTTVPPMQMCTFDKLMLLTLKPLGQLGVLAVLGK